MSAYKVETFKLCHPSLNEVAKAFQEHLPSTFAQIGVQVVDCPDLTQKPFMLSCEGLSGTPCLADVGGTEYFVPLARKDKIYSLKEIAKYAGVPNALIIGAGVGPGHHAGVNCEMMANLQLGEKDNINTRIAKLDKDGVCELVHLKDSTEFCMMGNLYISEGKPGKAIKVVAKERKGKNNFVTAMRLALARKFQDPVGIGGTFVIRKGEAKLHIMPDYSEKPLTNIKDFNNWLKYFNFPAPLTCLSTFISKDPGLKLRVEHTHCFSDHGVGGHYYEDTTPESVEYEGYFNVANVLYRVDRPTTVFQLSKY